MAKQKTSGRRRVGSTKAGRDIIAGLTELAELLEAGRPPGGVLTVRTVRVSSPRRYTVAAVRSLRKELGVSQGVFAQMLGVSTKLVQTWEAGRKVPAPWARRLLDLIAVDPAGSRELLLEVAPAA